MENIELINNLFAFAANNTIILCLIGIMFVWSLFLLILIIVVFRRQTKVLNRVEDFMGPIASQLNLEKLLVDFVKKSEAVSKQEEKIISQMKEIDDVLSYTIQKVGIVRYNPFPEVGGDLSFSIALLDRTNSGFVITGIYSRQSSYTYLKPIRKGRGDENDKRYRLSSEETEAVQRAMVAH